METNIKISNELLKKISGGKIRGLELKEIEEEEKSEEDKIKDEENAEKQKEIMDLNRENFEKGGSSNK